MFSNYIQEAFKRARYELIEDEDPYYGEVAELPGVWASGRSLEECRENLREVIEGWLFVRLQKGLPIPACEEISVDLLNRILRRGNISRKEWLKAK